MDQIKIGKFIAEMRKEQNLTQIDLAEQLGISNKTISKWECGNGMPDYSVMENLCEILKINVNELLSGERLPSKDYNKKAEENMMSLMQESSENQKKEKRDFIKLVLGMVIIVILCQLVVVSFGGWEAVNNFIDAPLLMYTAGIIVCVLLASGMLKDFIKAFTLIRKKTVDTEIGQIRKSMMAVKMAIVTANIAGILATLSGVIPSLAYMVQLENTGVRHLMLWISVAMLSICYGLIFTLIMIPVYMRLKAKIIEE